jgi:hypothetical protein
MTASRPPALPFRLADGVSVPDAHLLREGFEATKLEVGYWRVCVNVSAERIPEVFRRLVARLPGPGSLLLEAGTPSDEEARLRQRETDPFHADVWQLDHQHPQDVLALFRDYERLLVHDGLVSFGYGAYGPVDQVLVWNCKVFWLSTADPGPSTALLRELGYACVSELGSGWHAFTDEGPWTLSALSGERPSVQDLLAALRARGLHFAQRRAQP